MVLRHLITGGARSGKSAYAERRALDCGLDVTYFATAVPGDEEMRARIAHHRQRRPAAWRTVECGADLARALEGAPAGGCAIVDCLTLWLNAIDLTHVSSERERLLAALRATPARVLLIVTNELGSGVVPMGERTRAFVDEHGITNRHVAELCHEVTLMVCGQPLAVKRDVQV
jgi:adenosylcobinamide kinase / adenosylcobinamide-phosphate guanylyltransferase